MIKDIIERQTQLDSNDNTDCLSEIQWYLKYCDEVKQMTKKYETLNKSSPIKTHHVNSGEELKTLQTESIERKNGNWIKLI